MRRSDGDSFRGLVVKVVQIVSCIGKESSGPSYSVPGLCRGLLGNGIDVSLHTLEPNPERDFTFPFFCYPRDRGLSGRIGCSRVMRTVLLETNADIIHNNGFWEGPNVYPWRIVCQLRKAGRRVPKIVNSPRGVFAPWALAHHAWKKRLFGVFGGQYAAMRRTDLWHATSEKEYEEIRAAGYRQPVAIIPIGMDLPSVEKREGVGESSGRPDRRLKRVAFFGRLHKVKAVDNLVRAWSRLVAAESKLTDNWELVIAGPDCGSKPELERIISDGRIPRVRFVGEIKGDEKYRFLSWADVYVLPSLTENFGVTLAEALVCGVPCIASQGTPWSGLVAEKAGCWVPIGIEPLVTALRELMTLTDEERQAMGARGREWIRRDFSWHGVGLKMKAAYEWLLDPSRPHPDWIKVS